MTRLAPASPTADATTPWEVPLAVILAVIGVTAAGADPRALPFLYLAAVTPQLIRVDLVLRRLPNRMVLPGYLVAVVGAVGHGTVAGWSGAGISLAAGVVYFGFLLVPALLGGMGMGDVKLAGVLGLSAGLLGPTAAVLSPVAAFLLGGVAAVVALARGSGGSIPFGPFLLGGFWLAVALT